LTGIDALSHAVESYVTSKRSPVSQMFAREGWRLLEVNLEKVLQDPRDLEARGAMQMGAFLAGTAIENSMLGVCHACANPLTAHYGITHGLAIGIMLPHVIRYNASAVEHLYGDLIDEAGLANGHIAVASDLLAERMLKLMEIAKLPRTLTACGVSRGILPVLAEEAAQQWTARFNPRPVTDREILGLLEAAL
jgi:alcohol dehydrogenase